MSKYYVGKVDESRFAEPPAYADHSDGYRRLSLVDHAISLASVHLGAGLVERSLPAATTRRSSTPTRKAFIYSPAR